MKRVWFAFGFIILSVLLCVYEQGYVKNTCEEMTSILVEAQIAEETKNDRVRDEKIKELQDYWKRKNDFLFMFSEHGGLDELGGAIRSLERAHNMRSEIEETRNKVVVYYENERITFANIF